MGTALPDRSPGRRGIAIRDEHHPLNSSREEIRAIDECHEDS
jgi:hypothetical protein